jgi:hypothetical protein
LIPRHGCGNEARASDERLVLLDILDDQDLPARPGQTVIGDKNYYGRDFEAALAQAGLTLLRPARKGEPEPAGRQYFKPLRQVIESFNDTTGQPVMRSLIAYDH